MDAGIKVN